MWLHLLWTGHWKNCDYDAMLLSYKHAKQMAKNNNLRHGPKQLPNKYPYLYPKTMPSAIRSDSIISWLSHATITLNHYHIELFRNHLLFLPFYAFLVSQNHIFPIQQNNKNYTPLTHCPNLSSPNVLLPSNWVCQCGICICHLLTFDTDDFFRWQLQKTGSFHRKKSHITWGYSYV